MPTSTPPALAPAADPFAGFRLYGRVARFGRLERLANNAGGVANFRPGDEGGAKWLRSQTPMGRAGAEGELVVDGGWSAA